MEVEVSANESEAKNKQSSKDVGPSTEPSMVQVSPVPTQAGEKLLARPSSELSSSPNVNKIAKLTPRTTRSSQNPDFAAKQRKFLNRVHDPARRENSDSDNSQESTMPSSSKQVKENKSKSVERKSFGDMKRKSDRDPTTKRSAETDEEGSPKKWKKREPTKVVGGVDSYCWRCHRDGNVIRCEICPRVYHLKCVQMEAAPPKGWMCPECSTVMQAENTDTRSRAMRMLTLDQFCNLLRFALNRMKNYEGSEDFANPVDLAEFPQYRDFIVKPMDLTQLERNIKARMYGSTEAFQADAKWIVHNSIIFNSVQSKFTNTARALLKICRQEMQEIENCPDCYQNAHTRSTDSWFIEACRRPHMLVWAKLKGFPFWPAKAMTTNNDNLVDVRFFGAHDRAWVPLSSCYLYSKLSPAPPSNKNKRNLEDCLQELECHIKKLRDKFGQFEYAPYKTPYDPTKEDAQLAMLLPKYEAKGPGKRLRFSLHQDGARKSFTQRKSSPAPVASEGTPVDSTKSNPSVIKTTTPPKQTPQINKSLSKDSPVTAGNKPETPMVIICTEQTKSIAQKQDTSQVEVVKQSTSVEWASSDNPETPTSVKKPHKIPLTAAAKKCFATKDKSCAKCQTKASDSWQPGQNGEFVCAACSLPQQVDKPQIQFKKDGQTNDPNSTMTGIITVQRTQQPDKDNSEVVLDDSEIRESISVSVEPEVDLSPGESEAAASVDERAAGDGAETVDLEEEGESHTPSASGDTLAQDFAAVDSPPKFIIPKACESDSSEATKKVSIVDKLKEKLCFAVEEAIGPLDTEKETDTESNVELDTDKTETVLETNVNKEPFAKDDNVVVKVVLHDLKNDKEMLGKIREIEENQRSNKISKTIEIEVHSSSETGSEPDTDASSSLESDSFVTDEENSKKKIKQNNINNVVRTLKERKSSVEDRTERNLKSPDLKEQSTLMLDDANNEGPVLIIDEGEYNSSDIKKSNGKTDKSRRKGIPAKVYSRSSTSTESSETSSPEDHLNKSKKQCVKEVLDEVSGQFRRSSGESNLTITLVTDNESPQKKTAKEIRSVNISKSLSLSVINDSSAGLEMECVESDLEDHVIVDSVIKKETPRPTARKTLPNPPKSLDLPCLQDGSSPSLQSKANEAEFLKLRQAQSIMMDPSTPPPPLINLRQQTKVYGPSKLQNGGQPLGLRSQTVRAPPLSTPRTELGPVNTQLEEAVKKASDQLRSALEDMLRGMSDSGALEATVKTLQLEMERLQWRHRQEIAELKHNTDLMVMEYRASLEAEKQRALLDAKHKHEIDKEQAVQETKRKQWCAFCYKEAQLYCCWNTAYCSYNCQQSHWMPHMNSCLNKQQGNNAEVSPRVGPPRPPYNQTQGQVGYMINNS